jgi:hypothetical protein
MPAPAEVTDTSARILLERRHLAGARITAKASLESRHLAGANMRHRRLERRHLAGARIPKAPA